ncbi:DegQ family serine endoprotease [Thermithiobacillus plumbiphilus]|uniref:Probable periplasmic serine endoprotease DegP-like n=1 Tax=Thermithiobacillus plumbiphilus TaxID=1729899 RepID=A0ABU9DAH9_9PROT
MRKRSQVLVSLLLIPLALGACDRQEKGQERPFTSTENKTAPARQAPVSGLPDFTRLVKEEGPAVVNISTLITAPERAPMTGLPQMPGGPESDPFFDFFRRFMDPEEAPPTGPSQSLGSGFIISADGYILTNAHVVANAAEITVRMTDEKEYRARLIGSDKLTDVALLKVDAKGLPTVRLGNIDKVQVGEWVAAIGSPFGFDNSVTAGIVSAIGRSLPTENYVPFIQTDVAVNPGNSGGPLFDLNGNVIGINSQIYSQTGGYMGLSFAIPINVALDVANQLREHGKVTRGRLGIAIQSITPELARSFNLPDNDGALVASVEPGSPAERAGLMTGDVVLQYNGEPIKSANELPRMVAASKPGSKAILDIWRKGRKIRVNVTVGEMRAETQAQPMRPPVESNPLGLGLQELPPEQSQQLGIRGGLLIERVEGAAAAAGLQRGDVILALNNTGLQTLEQFGQLISQLRPGQTIALLIQREGNALYVPITIPGGKP